MGMYGSRAVTLLVLISDNVINQILKLDIQTNILIYVTRCCTDLTSKVLKERTFGQSSALLLVALLSYICIVTISVLSLFLAVSWVGMQCVIVIFPDHTHLLFAS